MFFNSSEALTPISASDDYSRRDCMPNAEKDLKQGIMWAVRAVALPDSF